MKSVTTETSGVERQIPLYESLARSVGAILPIFAALSILYTPSVSAQTTPAHVCVVERDDLTGNSIFLENTCENNIDVKGMHNSNLSCDPINASDKIPDDLIGIGNPATVCIEYSSDTLQTAAGFQGCDSVTISRCGQTGLTKVNPLRLPATIVLSDTETLNITEGDSKNFSVSLSRAPSADVTVSLTETSHDITLDKTSLTFTAGSNGDWSTPQTITVNTVEDDDAVDETATITLSASGYSNVTKSVAIDDDDDPAIEVNPASLTITEGGQATFQVKLATEPSANIRVTFGSSDESLVDYDTDPNSAGDQDFLVFGASQKAWDQYQTVTISAVHDNDTDHESVTIRATGNPFSSAEEYRSKTASVAVTITDDDKPSGTIQVTPAGTLPVNEGSSANLSVSLSTAPNADVTVSLAKTNSDITLDKTSLTFTTSNWNRTQTITVNAAQDADTTNDSGTITLTASGGINAPQVTKAVSVTDTTSPPGTIQVTPSDTLSVNEGGSANLSVSLSTAPSADVTVSLAKTNDDIRLDKTSLTFTTANFGDAQTVSVSAVEDDDTADDSDTITLSASGGIDAPDVTKAVAVTDNDVVPLGTIQVIQSGPLNIAEGGSGTFRVRLSTAPNADVTISLSKTNDDISLNPTSLTFTTANFGDAQSVSVTAAEDDDTANDSDTITLSASGGIAAPYVTKAVVVADNDAPSGTIQVTPSGALNIAEGGSAKLSVRLSTAPNANVTISLSKTNDDIRLDKTSLTFTASDYSAQSVSVTAAEDDDATDDSDTITFTASGGITAPSVTKAVAVVDNDTSLPPPPTNPYDGTLTITPDGDITLDEAGDMTIAIALSKRPIVDVPVLISKTSYAPNIGFSRASMVFTPEDWNEAQTLRVSAHEDADKDDSVHTIAFDFAGKRILRKAIVRDNDKETLKTQALALPPPSSGDSVNIRVQCKQQTPCAVALDCTAQTTGEVFEGRLPEPVPAWGAVSLSSRDIQAYTGGESWAGKGRLGCALRSSANIGSQVWTRSGNGVLVNNSAMIRSVPEGDIHRADIESIPSPDASDESNIRIRCNSNIEDCLETSFVCYSDEGRRYAWELGSIERLRTRHLQSEELASGIGYRWEGLGLACEIRSGARFTAQVLTRTGGGGALVNNSATGVR